MRLRHGFVSLLIALAGLVAGPTAASAGGADGAIAIASASGSAMLVADREAQAYDPWIADAISKISGDDEHEQSWAADQLALAVPYAPVRSKVLAALEPHLNGGNKGFRQRCVKAYGHWATAAQVGKLLEVVATPPNPPNMSGDESSWAAAVAALVSLDPKAAREAMEQRIGSFFFRDALTGMLISLTADNGPAQPVAFELLKQMDPSNGAVQLTVADSIDLLRSDSARDRTRAADALSHAVIRPGDRAAVLALLKPHLMGNKGRARLPFVQAFAHWATAENVADLKAIIAYPATAIGNTGHEDCWAAATVGLARLDPKAAGEALAARSSAFLYRVTVQRFLEMLAKAAGPTAPTAAWLLKQLPNGDRQPPLPPSFDLNQPSPKSPTGPGSAQPRA
jgi:hypothetical protein